MSEKSVEDYLDEAAKARAPEAPAEDEGKSAKPDTGEDTADLEEDKGEEQEAQASDDTESDQEGEESEDSEGEDDKPKPRPPTKAQKRIRKLVRERDDANRRLEQREAELRVLLAQVQNGAQDATKKTEQPQDAPPKQEDYQDYAQFLADTAAWSGRMEARKAVEAVQQANQESARKSRVEAAQNERVAAAKVIFAKGEDAFEDFADIAGSESLRVTDAMTDTISEMEDGHKVLYHLGQNPDEAERIADLKPVAQVRELTKLEAKLIEPSKSVASKKTTSASATMKG